MKKTEKDTCRPYVYLPCLRLYIILHKKTIININYNYLWLLWGHLVILGLFCNPGIRSSIPGCQDLKCSQDLGSQIRVPSAEMQNMSSPSPYPKLTLSVTSTDHILPSALDCNVKPSKFLLLIINLQWLTSCWLILICMVWAICISECLKKNIWTVSATMWGVIFRLFYGDHWSVISKVAQSFIIWAELVPSLLWHCCLGFRKSILPVKIEWWGVDVVICLERGADCLLVVQLMPLHPKTPPSLAHLNPDGF